MSKISDLALANDTLQVVDFLSNALETVEGTYTRLGVPMPERRLWAVSSLPAIDCEQISVEFVQTYLGLPGDEATEPTNCTGPRSIVYLITVSRCVPAGKNGRPPSVESYTEHQKTLAVDVAVLLEATKDLTASKNTWSNASTELIATVNAGEENGGYISVSLSLSQVLQPTEDSLIDF